MDLTPYRLWHETLRMELLPDHHGPRKKVWKPAVKRDLGSALSLPFEAWWEEVGELLEPMDPFLVRVIESKREADKFVEYGEKDLAYFMINLNYPTDTLMREIEAQIKGLRKFGRGRPNYEPLAEYPMARHPNLLMIRRLLDVYHQRHENKKLWEIGRDLKVTEFVTGKDAGERILLNGTVSRYSAKAEKMIQQAALGLFPVY